MFRELISKPIDPISLEYIRTISRINNEPDYSLTCLGVALLKPRIENYSGIDGVYGTWSEKETCISDFISRVNEEKDRPLFCYYKYQDANEEAVKTYLPRLSEFKEKTSVSAFVKDKTGSECMILYHEKVNKVAIFVSSNDIRLYHLLLSFVSLYYPALFKDKPLSEEDYNVIKSLSKTDRKNFYDSIKKLVAPYAVDFRRLQMENFLKQMHEVKVLSAKNAVDNHRSVVDQAEERFARAIRELNNLIVVYEGMKATQSYDKAEEDLVEYLATNGNIHGLNIQNNRIYFSVSTLLNNYNIDAWEVFSKRGGIYNGEYNTRITSDAFKKEENRKILFDSIFSDDPLLMVRMAGNYQLDIQDNRVYTSDRYDYTDIDPVFQNCLPNPHLKLFSCLGGYKDRVMRALMDRNYIGAIELCIASAGSVNLDETTQTFRPFLGWILNSTDKILVTKDGKEMTPEEALIWLIDKEKE